MCCSTSCRERNDSGHSGHWCSVECVSMCRCSEPFVVKVAEHLVQGNCLPPECVFTCAISRLIDPNVCLHSKHSYGLQYGLQPTRHTQTHTSNYANGQFLHLFVLTPYRAWSRCVMLDDLPDSNKHCQCT